MARALARAVVNGNGVDVAAVDGLMQQPRAGDGQHARACADVERMAGTAALQHFHEREETAESCAVMPGAEGERRLDLDADVVCAKARAVMRAMHENAAGADGLQSRQRVLDPVALFDGGKADGLGGLVAEDGFDEPAQRVFVGRVLEEHLGRPLARLLVLEDAGRGLGGIESFDDEIGDRARARRVAHETQQRAGPIGRQTFKHAACLARGAAIRQRASQIDSGAA